MGKSCTYNGQTYSHGSVVCQSGTEYRCNDGSWDSLGTSCGTKVTSLVSVDPDLQNVTLLACLSFFAAGLGRVGIRNGCPECKLAVVSWSPNVGVRRYRVNGHSEIIINLEDQTGQLIGEDPCP
jgi:hypothetical protein